MDTTFLKLVVLWTISEIIGQTTCMSLKYTDDATFTRLKRSPADNFSLFQVRLRPPFSVSNPITKVKESFDSFGGIFGRTSASQDRNGALNNLKSTNNKPTHTVSPIDESYQSSHKPADRETVQQEYKSKEDIKTTSGNQIFNDNSKKMKGGEPEIKNDDSKTQKDTSNGTNDENTKEELSNEGLEQEIDEKLLDYIFHFTPDNNIEDISTTTDNTDYTTETGDYETTTTDELLRIPANVVASLLG